MKETKKKMGLSNKFYPIKNDKDISSLVERAKETGLIGIQIEVTGSDPLSDCIETIWIGTGENDLVAMISLQSIPPFAREGLQRLLSDEDITKIFYDALEDCSFLEKKGFAVSAKKFDIITTLGILNAGLTKPKDPVGEYLKQNGLPVSLGEYNESRKPVYLNRVAKSVRLLFHLRERLVKEIYANDLVETATIEFHGIKAANLLRLSGIRVDVAKLKAIWEENKNICNQLENEIFSFLPEKFYLKNMTKLKQTLNSHPEIIKVGIHFEDVSKSTLIYHSKKFPVLQSILDHRKKLNLLQASSQIMDAVNVETNRVHSFYNPMGAVTGRFSCSSPPLQSLPNSKNLRACFVAGEGKKLVIADYSQIELRIAAEISNDLQMIQAFRSGADFHSLAASIITGKPVNAITKTERDSAKAINFGMIFGMQPIGLVDYAYEQYQVALSIDEAVEFQEAFFNEYQDFKRWSQIQTNTRLSESRTIGGRRRLWNDPLAKASSKLNTPIQGTAADILKGALNDLSGKLSSWDALLVACIHDEIILEVDEDNAEFVAQELARVMEDAGRKYLSDVPVVVDVKINDHWS